MAFEELRRGTAASLIEHLPHLLPAVAVLGLAVSWRLPIDAVLFATYLGYGLALLRAARMGPDGLAATRLGDGVSTYRALVAVAILLIVTAFIDAGVSLALVFGEPRQAMAVLTVASVLWLAAAGYAATVADAGRPETDLVADGMVAAVDSRAITPPSSSRDTDAATLPPVREEASEEDAAVLRRLDTLMVEQALYRDPDLTLDRLARRAGLPSRRISAAVNRIHGRNVSQVINEFRVDAARRMLVSTADPVTSIMLEVGFGTKSNFHREFQRVTGMTPSAYRHSSGSADVAEDDRANHPVA
ncbi:helix-turn-helix domain-containing protein [Aureimonas sp. Leaf427]|uniref:helix-turn-helix domain-containing protein n=1 Tax=Aureimonas sp. Leaf427 TaxID=1736375 RepID=UPI001FCD3383|nr:AraC family transcriptional regulator [Aureimonas sp. Leaf427]